MLTPNLRPSIPTRKTGLLAQASTLRCWPARGHPWSQDVTSTYPRPMRKNSILAKLVVASLAFSLWQLPVASGALTGLTLVVTPTSTQNAYGSNPSGVVVEVNFISTEAAGEHLKLSANIVAAPAGQNVQATIAQVASTNATLEMFDSTSHIKAVNAGVVNAKFNVSIRSATSTPLSAGTYSLLVFAGSTSGSQQQSVSFVISPPPAPTLSLGLSKIWMAPGSTTANESNNASSVSGSASVDMKNQTANLTVDLRDTNNSQISNLPITVAVTGPGAIGIGSNASTNNLMGRAVIGQPGQYSISVYADGTYGTSTISIYQNGQLIGSRSVIFTQPVAEPASVSFSNISISTLSAKAGESVRVQFSTRTTSLATGQEAYVSINSYEDCESEDCAVGGTAKLTSGDSSNGTWLSALNIPANAISGEYTITIYFPKLKGVKDFYYRHPARIVVKGVEPAPPTPPASASMSILSSNNKTPLTVGETFIVKVAVKTSNFPQGVPIQATIFTANDCEDESCSAWGVGKLISGNLENGVWEIPIPIHNQLLSGKYSLNYGFFKLKGTPGVIGTAPDFLNVQGVTAPPAPIPAIIKISNIRPNSTATKVGNVLEVQFDMASTNLTDNEMVQVYLTDDASGNCDEGCGIGVAKLIQGSIANGAWVAQFSIPSTVPTGNYGLVVALPKRKGSTGAYAVYSQQIYVTGAPRFTPIYSFSSVKTSMNSVRVGQTITGYFYLKTNDDKVSTPACIIDGVVGWTAAKLIEGSAMSGSWSCSISIPSNAVSGNYKLQVAVVGYANGDKNEQWADLGLVEVSGTTLVQSATTQQCLNYFNVFPANWSAILASYNEMKNSLVDPKFSQVYFTGKYRSWSELYSDKMNSINRLAMEAEKYFNLANSNEVLSCDAYDFSKGLGSKYTSIFAQLSTAVKGLNPEINSWFQRMQAAIPDPVKHFNPQIENGVIDVQKVSEPTLGKVSISFAYQSSAGVAKITCSSSYGLCNVLQNGLNASGNSYSGVAEISNIPPGTLLNFSLSQLGSNGNQIASVRQTYTSIRAGLQPSIGPVTSIAGGCSFKILNYDPAFTWFAKSEMKIARDGTATIISGSPQGTDEYLSTSRVGYQTVNALNTLFKCIPISSSSGSIGTNTTTGNPTTEAPVITVEDDGLEESPTGNLKVKRESSGKFLLTISSNLSEEKLNLTASRKGKTSIRFSATTNEDGAVQIRTSRNLSGYSIKLVYGGEVLRTVKVA